MVPPKDLKIHATLDVRYKDIEIKQHPKVTYLGCILDNNLSGEVMATKVLGTINGRLKFLSRKQKFLSFSLRQLLCNALIQPHFDYACLAWYPNLTKRHPHTHLNFKNLSITATTREGRTADYSYHTEIPVMVITLFLSQSRNYGI